MQTILLVPISRGFALTPPPLDLFRSPGYNGYKPGLLKLC